ncbi:MAG: imidazole glycerol phosphate synthase subunit HisH, partial [Myxococcota bacterium]
MSGRAITIVETGLANLASVQAAWIRLGHRPQVTTDAAEVRDADLVMLPGVGAFGPGMAMLAQYGLDDALRERVGAGRPTLAVCLGLQLLAERSDEAGNVTGLGILPASVERLAGPDRVPHMGWAPILPTPTARLLSPGFAYFAHSYAIRGLPEGYAGATSQHSGRSFVAAVEHGAVLAMQFHPELSGALGEALL